MDVTGSNDRDRPFLSESLVVRVDPRQNGRTVSVREVRRRAGVFLRRFVAAGVVCEEAVRDVLLVAGELLSNALKHAAGPYRFSMVVAADGVTVAVRDRSIAPPREVAAPTAGGGYGLWIVGRVSGGVTTMAHPDGKTVAATVPFPRPA